MHSIPRPARAPATLPAPLRALLESAAGGEAAIVERAGATLKALLGERAGERALAALLEPKLPDSELSDDAQRVIEIARHLVQAARLAGDSQPFVPRAAPPPGPLLRPGPKSGLGEGSIGRSTQSRAILVVEDDPMHAEIMAAVLAERGHEVTVTHDGPSALVEARRRRFDVLLLDVQVPDMDGLAVAERLREDPRTAHLPILFVSGNDDLMVRMRGLSLGAVDFLGKPLFAPELIARVERCAEEAARRAELTYQARVDPLTGLANLRALEERMRLETARALRYATPLAVIMIDVDGLKRINDEHGHTAGSRALVAIGRVLSDETRETDLAARYGGDEFVVLLPHAGPEEGRRFAERTLARLRKLELDGLPGLRIAASFGVGGLAAHQQSALGANGEQAWEVLLAAADSAAYEAKRLGGARVCVAKEREGV